MLPGLGAVALFVVMAVVFLAADYGTVIEEFGFPAGESIVASIGAALIGIEAAIPVESFLVALLIIAVALDAALDGSIMLAKRDESNEASPDGGASPADEEDR